MTLKLMQYVVSLQPVIILALAVGMAWLVQDDRDIRKMKMRLDAIEKGENQES